MNTPMYYVGGSKGGVGKSLFSFALVDYLLQQERNVLLVDTDTDNPDVYKAHNGLELPNLLCLMNALDDADGWAELLDTVQNYPEHTVVINAAARTKTSTTSYGDIMQGALQEMQRELMVFWIINRHRDSIELLHSFQQAFPGAEVLVTGVVDPDSRMHGIDESFDLADFTSACIAEASFLAALAAK